MYQVVRSAALSNVALDFRYIAPFSNESDSKAKYVENPCQISHLSTLQTKLREG